VPDVCDGGKRPEVGLALGPSGDLTGVERRRSSGWPEQSRGSVGHDRRDHGSLYRVTRKLIVDLPSGEHCLLEQQLADNELQLQERLKLHPELMPLEELGLIGPALVIGRESSLDSGRVDLVLLGRGGDLAIVEFKTGPKNPDFRECLAQLLDYGSDLWGMTLEEFETRVVRQYFDGHHCPPAAGMKGVTLEHAVLKAWPAEPEDAVDWRERLQAQLRDGSFLYVAVAQRFTPSVLRTLRYMNEAMKAARFSAVELVRFSGKEHTAFEARFVAGASPAVGKGSGSAKLALAGVDELLANVTDDDYRYHLHDLFDTLGGIDGLTVFWGTTGCSLRATIPDHSPLSIGWIFPPGPTRWMGLSDVTLGWYQDANGLAVSEKGKAALTEYHSRLADLPGAAKPKSGAIHGMSFAPIAVVANVDELVESIRAVVASLILG